MRPWPPAPNLDRLRRACACLLLAGCVGACGTARSRIDAAGTAADLRNLAAARGARLEPTHCATVGGTRVVVCRAEVPAADLERLRTALEMAPSGHTQAPGPAHGSSTCFDSAPPSSLELVTSFPWMPKKHYQYLLIVVPPGGGTACIETEHGYG